MREVVIVRVGEIWTKSEVTRRWMMGLLKRQVERISGKRARVGRGRIYVDGGEELAKRLSRVFGVTSTSPAISTERELGLIKRAVEELSSGLKGTFAVRVQRSYKGFPLTSPELAKILGAHVVKMGLKVDLDNPDHLIEVEISDKAYVFTSRFEGPGGLPYGSQGKGLVLFSGGIDSPVASWMMAKRGLSLEFLFLSPGFPDVEESVREVHEYLKREWYLEGELHIVRAQDLFLNLPKVREGYRQVVFKRALYRVASRLAEMVGAEALVTGESLGQVSSQTLRNLRVIEGASSLPVLRPLVGMDKEEITRLARKIGTYDLSIRVREICSMERHSNASTRLEDVIKEEEKVKGSLPSLSP